MSWQREFKGPNITLFGMFFGSVFFLVGVFFIVVMGWLGVFPFIAGLIIPAAVLWFASSITVTCNEQGFVVRRSTRASGKTETAYGWHEVTATQYYERRPQRGGPLTGHFLVETSRGRAFDLSQHSRGFREMIDLFNTMTVQLPYVWTPQTGFSISVGPASMGRAAYHAVPRQ